ncbi:hypothetical protein [Paenisporosarcina quisquiliarum]|nr:hypothetical protein [Paenisporosarcina quisquiliarum]
MRIGSLIKTAVKFAPIIIPIVKKVMDSRKNSTTSTTTFPRK